MEEADFMPIKQRIKLILIISDHSFSFRQLKRVLGYVMAAIDSIQSRGVLNINICD